MHKLIGQTFLQFKIAANLALKHCKQLPPQKQAALLSRYIKVINPNRNLLLADIYNCFAFDLGFPSWCVFLTHIEKQRNKLKALHYQYENNTKNVEVGFQFNPSELNQHRLTLSNFRLQHLLVGPGGLILSDSQEQLKNKKHLLYQDFSLVDFSQLYVSHSEFTNCIFNAKQFYSAKFANSKLDGSLFNIPNSFNDGLGAHKSWRYMLSFENSNFINCSLKFCLLARAYLRGAHFKECDLSNACLDNALGRGVVFENCNFESANLSNVEGIVLNGSTNLRASNLYNAEIYFSEGTIINRDTIFYDGSKPIINGNKQNIIIGKDKFTLRCRNGHLRETGKSGFHNKKNRCNQCTDNISGNGLTHNWIHTAQQRTLSYRKLIDFINPWIALPFLKEQ